MDLVLGPEVERPWFRTAVPNLFLPADQMNEARSIYGPNPACREALPGLNLAV